MECKTGMLYSYCGVNGHGDTMKDAIIDWTDNAYKRLDDLLKEADMMQNAINNNKDIDWELYGARDIARKDT